MSTSVSGFEVLSYRGSNTFRIDISAQFEFDIQQQPLRDVDFSRLGQLAAVRQNDVLSATGNRDTIVLTLA